MSQMWHYQPRNGERRGPVSVHALRQLARSGALAPDDLVWREGLPDWVPARKLKGLEYSKRPDAVHREDADQLRLAAWARLRQVAVHHRAINLTIAGAIVGIPVVSAILAPLAVIALLGAGVLYAWQISLLSQAMGRNVKRDVATACVPFVGQLLTVRNLVQPAGRLMKANGVEVGFLGAVVPPNPPATFQASPYLVALTERHADLQPPH